MKSFGGRPNLGEIEKLVEKKMEEMVWKPVIQEKLEFGEAMDALIGWAVGYIRENDLSLWKASKVSGTIESIIFSNVPIDTGTIWRKRVRERLLTK